VHYRMMNEYGVGWPFWGEFGLCQDGEPELPPRLADDVRAWAADFNAGYSWETGWDSWSEGAAHERRGRGLFGAVEKYLEAQGHTVELHYWETTRPQQRG
jgi:hypothetical protein